MKKFKEKSKKLKKTEKILRKEIKTNNQRPEVRSYRQNQQKRTYRLDERAEGARENISDGQKKPENLTCVRLSGFLNTLDWIPVGYVQDEQKATKKGVTTKKGTDQKGPKRGQIYLPPSNLGRPCPRRSIRTPAILSTSSMKRAVPVSCPRCNASRIILVSSLETDCFTNTL